MRLGASISRWRCFPTLPRILTPGLLSMYLCLHGAPRFSFFSRGEMGDLEENEPCKVLHCHISSVPPPSFSL